MPKRVLPEAVLAVRVRELCRGSDFPGILSGPASSNKADDQIIPSSGVRLINFASPAKASLQSAEQSSPLHTLCTCSTQAGGALAKPQGLRHTCLGRRQPMLSDRASSAA